MFRGVIFSADIFARPPYGRVRRASVARRWVEGARDVLAARARVRSAVHRARLLAPPCRAPPTARGDRRPPRGRGALHGRPRPPPPARGPPGPLRPPPPRGGGAPPAAPGRRGPRLARRGPRPAAGPPRGPRLRRGLLLPEQRRRRGRGPGLPGPPGRDPRLRRPPRERDERDLRGRGLRPVRLHAPVRDLPRDGGRGGRRDGGGPRVQREHPLHRGMRGRVLPCRVRRDHRAHRPHVPPRRDPREPRGRRALPGPPHVPRPLVRGLRRSARPDRASREGPVRGPAPSRPSRRSSRARSPVSVGAGSTSSSPRQSTWRGRGGPRSRRPGGPTRRSGTYDEWWRFFSVILRSFSFPLRRER